MSKALLPLSGATRWANGLAELASCYDGFVIDQFGVLHDGHRPYSGAEEALQTLRAQGKRVIVLSNSGKRAAHNARRLAAFGVSADHVDGVLSSGELTWQMLHQRDRLPWSTLGTRVLLLSPDDDAAMIDGLPLIPVSTVVDADFLLLASFPEAVPPRALKALLQTASERSLPLICANPDRHRLTANGNQPGCGTLAMNYEALGGPVIWVGKPYPLIYEACREWLARLGATRICAIGDSLEHDVRGGAGAGFDTCFIAGGLHANDFARHAGKTGAADFSLCQDELTRLLALPETSGTPAPTWALTTLNW